MQKLQKEELAGFANEYQLTVAAQDGDGKAWLALWKHYKPMMMSRLIAVKGMSRQELESEAIEVFAKDLNSFDRTKVTSEDKYSMFTWLFCHVTNQTNKLIRKRKRDVHLYFEKVNAVTGYGEYNDSSIDTDNDSSPLYDQIIGVNTDSYFAYSPEKLVIEKLQDSDSDRIKEFRSRLSQFAIDILEARQQGMTLAEVADKFKCSVTTVKNYINRAKQCWGDVFDMEPRKFSYA